MIAMEKVSSYLMDSAAAVAEKIVGGVVKRLDQAIPEWEKDQAIAMYRELVDFLGASLLTENDEEGVPEALVDWSKKNAKIQAEAGGSISEIIIRYSPTREVFTEILTEISAIMNVPLEENAFLIKRINKLLDVSLNETVFAFERISKQYRIEAEREMAELSAPIVPLLNDVAVIPLIGDLDLFRAAHILEKVLPNVSAMQVKYLITDFSGIKDIDLEIARYLHQIGSVCRLLGIETFVTGLRPELAKTVVESGLDISVFKTFATVKQALEQFR